MTKSYTPSLSEIKELRNRTSVGINDCKDALTETKGDVDEAIIWLRKKGISKAAKRSGKVAGEGTIGVYVHGNSSLVTLVELNCETDFVAKNEDFKELAKNLAIHVAALGTEYIDKESIPEKIVKQEEDLAREDAKDKTKEVQDKIISGKMEKFYEEKCMMEQKYFHDDSKTVADVLNETVAKIGEKIEVSRILTWKVGKPGGYCSIIPDDIKV